MQHALQICKTIQLSFDNLPIMNWDDIKIFLEVARAERLQEAAKRLSLDTSTVSRRLHKLEESLTTKLFERTVDGHQLTPDGKLLLASAHKMELDANRALDSIQSQHKANSGLVRIGVTEAFGNFFIAPHLLTLQQRFPDIQVDLLHFSRFVKISRNEADIAIAIEQPKSTSMIVTKLCDYQLKLYAHPDYLNQQTYPVTIHNLEHHHWVGYIDKLLFTEQLSYLSDLGKDIIPKFRSTNVISQYTAINSGLGIGIIPCFLAAQSPELVQLCQREIDIVRSFYLVTHPESKRLGHVNSVWEFLKQLVIDKQTLLMPDQSASKK